MQATVAETRRERVLAAYVVQRADVGMVQPRDEMRLAIEPRAEVTIRRQPPRHDLDGDDARQARVARLVHLPHAAHAEQRKDFVRT